MLVNIYVVFSWSSWWYAVSYGQRAMVQSYVIMCFPLAALLQWIFQQRKWLQFAILCIFLFCIYLNLNFIWKAHYGKYFEGEFMTKRYFLRTLGKWNYNVNDLKLLDTEEEFNGNRENTITLFKSKLDSVYTLDSNNTYFSNINLQDRSGNYCWARVTAKFRSTSKEWNIWLMPIIMLSFKNNSTIIKSRNIKISRLLEPDNEWHVIYIDSKIPDEKLDTIEIKILNNNSQQQLKTKNIQLEIFK